MKNLYFDDFEDLACSVADTYDSLKDEEFEDIAIIAHYDEAKQIIREILCLGYNLNTIELKNPALGYDDVPYVISVCGIDAEHEVWCEPMIRENGKYIDDESSVIYILDNCSSKVIPHCKGKTVYEVTVGVDEYDEDDECDCECDECEEEFTVNGKPVSKEEFDDYASQFKHDEKPSTTTSKSTYKINNKEVSKEEFDKEYEKFEEMYLDNIRDMLLNYCNFMDEMNDWRSRFLRW